MMLSSHMNYARLGRDAFIRVFVLFLSSLLVTTTLPPELRAQLDSPAEQRADSLKGEQIEFVPGEILVRFRTEAIADVKEQAIAPLRSRGEEIPIDVQPFREDGGNVDIIEGLRFARVAPEETLQAIAALNARSDVIYAEPNYIRRRDITPNDSLYSNMWSLKNTGQSDLSSGQPGVPGADIDAEPAWDHVISRIGTVGSRSVVVGVIDEGIDITHPDLIDNIWTNPGEIPGDGIDNEGNGFRDDVRGWDFYHNDGSVYDGSANDDPATTNYDERDTDEHGTHVAGTIGATGNNARGVTGINWQVQIMSLKILGRVCPDSQPNCDPAAPATVRRTVQAYDYAVMMRNRGVNLRVLNNSYGGGGFSTSELTAIQSLNTAGILFVASAGNDRGDSDGLPHYPSSYDAPNIIAVAATDRFDNMSSFSTFGERTVSMGAPGSQILSTIPGLNNGNARYAYFSGTSMAAPHVTGAAALICAAYPTINAEQLRGVLAYSGDVLPALQGRTSTGRRLNLLQSLLSAAENDTRRPAPAGNLRISTQLGRNVTLQWTAPGDDDNSGRAADYDLIFTDQATNTRYPLIGAPLPDQPGTQQSVTVYIPFSLTSGSIELRTYDNAGNFSSASVNVTVNSNDIEPYAVATSPAGSLSSGTGLNLIGDDKYLRNYQLPFAFPFFGRNFNTLTVSTNGALYFSSPASRGNGDADDVPSTVADMTSQVMIAGMWDDLRTDRNNGDVFVTADSNRIIFRWQGTTFNAPEAPINFEIELRPDGTIQTRYGSGNTNLSPVVGISGGGPNAYVVTSHTEPVTSLTNAQTVTFSPRPATPPPPANPIDGNNFFVRQHYLDFLDREPEPEGRAYWTGLLQGCNGDATCLNGVRVEISSRFFAELEFQRTGYYVMRLWRASYGEFPNYQQFIADRRLVQNNEASQRAFAAQFVGRAEFVARYPASLTADQFVTQLYNTAGANSFVSEREAHRAALASGQKTRADVLHEVVSLPLYAERTVLYNAAWVRMQYFGYLRRDVEPGGEAYWTNVINVQLPNNYQAMICAFLNSAEYHARFGTQRGQFTETSCSRFY